jgi:aryl-alcohol dehydrogenase
MQIIPVPLPAVFGHEGCGIVEETGPGVTALKRDRVGFPRILRRMLCLQTEGLRLRRKPPANFSGTQLTGQSALVLEVRKYPRFSDRCFCDIRRCSCQ